MLCRLAVLGVLGNHIPPRCTRTRRVRKRASQPFAGAVVVPLASALRCVYVCSMWSKTICKI
jgi:hypothetical protein